MYRDWLVKDALSMLAIILCYPSRERLPNRLSLLARDDITSKASANVYGFSRLALSTGLKMRSKKALRVFGAFRTSIRAIVVGSVAFSSI